MAFNLELIKTKLADWFHGIETELGLGPEAAKLEASLHAVIDQAHAQVVVDEQTVKNQVIGDVKTVESDADDAATTAATEPAAPTADTKTGK